MKQLTILVDIHCLHTAETGIRKALEEFIALAQQESNNRHKYIFTPKIARTELSQSFRKRDSKFFRLLSQLELLFWKQIFIPLKSHLVKADAVFFPDYYAPIWKLRAHKVVMFHDTFFWDSPEHYGKAWLTYFRWLVLKGIERRASLITITNFAKERITQILPFPKDIKVIYHPQRNLTEDIQISQDVLRSLDLEPHRYFLHIGVFEKRKELLVLVKAFKQFLDQDGNNGFKLVLVGKRAPYARFDDWDEVVRLVDELALTDNVVLSGYLTDSEVASLYKSALCYVFPSNNEGFGLPIIEAFAIGCPVITSDQGALLEVSGDGAINFKVGQTDDLFSRLMDISQSSDLRNSLIIAGSIQLKKFDRDTYFETMEAYFSQVIEKGQYI
ncbi:MAG: glycosyltransferase involved in cell wall biosynthesis [Salibacteraceae bacterium]|jgi:glycosyltransferase involved in cell wall biosynthesis